MEHSLAHRLTERITRSAFDRYRRTHQLNNADVVALEPIEERSTPSPQSSLSHQDFFNDFSDKLYCAEDIEF